MPGWRCQLLERKTPVAKPPDMGEMGVNCLVEMLISRDEIRSDLKAQGKEQGVVHAPPVLDRQTVGGEQEGEARGDLEGKAKEGRNDRGPIFGTEAIQGYPLPDGVGELGIDQVRRQGSQGTCPEAVEQLEGCAEWSSSKNHLTATLVSTTTEGANVTARDPPA